MGEAAEVDIAAWAAANKVPPIEVPRALSLAAALRKNPDAAEAAAVQFQRSPSALDRRVERINEQGESDANERAGAAEGGEGLQPAAGGSAGGGSASDAGARQGQAVGQDGAAAAQAEGQVGPTLYKTRREAQRAKRELGNELKLLKVKGGYIIRPMTEREIAASAKAGRRAMRSGVDVTKDSLSIALAKYGGINRESALRDLGLHRDDFKRQTMLIGRPLFPVAGGKNAEDALQSMIEDGYLRSGDSLRDLESKLGDELRGRKQYSMSHEYESPEQEPRGPFDDFEPADLDAAGYGRDVVDVQDATEDLLLDAERAGIDTEAAKEDAARRTQDESENAYHAELQASLRAALEALSRDGGEDAGADTGAARGSDADRGEAAGEARPSGVTPTPEELSAAARVLASARKLKTDSGAEAASQTPSEAELGPSVDDERPDSAESRSERSFRSPGEQEGEPSSSSGSPAAPSDAGPTQDAAPTVAKPRSDQP